MFYVDLSAAQSLHASAVLGAWYDFTVTLDGDDSYARRFAGRIETGQPSVSDPEMGTA